MDSSGETPAGRLKILYLGPLDGTCLDRANAYRRLGHDVRHIDLRAWLPQSVWVERVIWYLGGDRLAALLLPKLRTEVRDAQFDICHVDGGEFVTPAVMEFLRQRAATIINYNIDDPLGGRDGARWRAYRQGLPLYDLCVVVRSQNVAEAKSLGARNVLRVFRSADEISHAPRRISSLDHRRFGSQVLFLGTWFPERGPFLRELIRRNIPLTIRGNHWQKAREWPELEPHWKGGSITGDEYAMAIQCAKVNLGLLSKGNRDLHTTRSMEIPSLGGLLCAERTAEHIQLYEEGTEALFWSDVAECAALCRHALEDEPRRLAISEAGRSRYLSGENSNEKVLLSILRNAETLPHKLP